MSRRCFSLVFGTVLGLGLWMGGAPSARAADENLDRYFYYPYYYFPHNYWPQQSPPWPEPPGAPYQPRPAYMTFPPFHEANWRYEYWQRQWYYRGSHFWLDVF